MPDQEDDAGLAPRRRMAAVEGLLERAGHLEAVLVRSPELRVLFDPRTDRWAGAEAKVRSAIRDYAELGEDVIADRLEDAITRKTTRGAPPRWGTELSPEGMIKAMTQEIAGQPRPNVTAAARAVAAREPEAVTFEAVRQAWIKFARKQGLSGGELAQHAWEEAQGRVGQPSQ